MSSWIYCTYTHKLILLYQFAIRIIKGCSWDNYFEYVDLLVSLDTIAVNGSYRVGALQLFGDAKMRYLHDFFASAVSIVRIDSAGGYIKRELA